MITLKKILVATPASLIQSSVMSQSIRIAQKQQSHVTFISVAEELPKEQLSWITVLPPQDLMDDLLEKQQLSLNNNVEQFHHDFLSVDTHNAIGVPFIEVTKKVIQEHYDLVILAAKDNNHSSKRFFGSTTVHLMRKCPCPILAIGSNEDKPMKRIVAAIDVYAPTKEGQKLNESILHWAANIATLENAELHVIHAWQLPGEDYLKGWGFTSEIDRLEMVMKEKQDRQERFDEIIDNNLVTEERPNTQLIEGLAQEKIPQYVEENDIDLLVMGTVCRTGIAGFFIGNTAEAILSEISCSVLTLKPEGFISPVE